MFFVVGVVVLFLFLFLKQTMWTMAVVVVNLLLEQTTADQS